MLNDIRKSLKDFPTMPFPGDVFLLNDGNRLIVEETSYNVQQMKETHDSNFVKFNKEQMKFMTLF